MSESLWRGIRAADAIDGLDPDLLAFIREHIRSFARWEILRFLCENEAAHDTLENLARYMRRAPDRVRAEADELVAEDLLQVTEHDAHRAYALTDEPKMRQTIASLVEAAQDHAFRVNLLYHILRAGGQT